MGTNADAATQVRALLARGVRMPLPATVHVAPEIDPGRIAPGVILHPGTRLLGAATLVGPGSEVGAEAPATIDACRLGRGVSLRGGFFAGSTFLDGVSVGSGAHVRPGTLLEEQSAAAHAVGFKQTVLMPFVAVGSLVNLCDCLVAGGTGPEDYSEVGSSYVHFNFTPRGDKATASLIGDVPFGVRLDQPRIFLGGQGGLVGPARIAYGAVIAAGVVQRRDVTGPGAPGAAPAPRAPRAVRPGAYGSVDRLVRAGLAYIGHLAALRAWYDRARRPAAAGDPWRAACVEGALAGLDLCVAERIRQLGELAGKMPRSLELARAEHGVPLPGRPYAEQRRLAARWPAMREALEGAVRGDAGGPDREAFLAAWAACARGRGHVEAVRALPAEAREAATRWLQAVVASVERLAKGRSRGAGAGP